MCGRGLWINIFMQKQIEFLMGLAACLDARGSVYGPISPAKWWSRSITMLVDHAVTCLIVRLLTSTKDFAGPWNPHQMLRLSLQTGTAHR